MLVFILKIIKFIRFLFHYLFIKNSRVVAKAYLEMAANQKVKDYRGVYVDPNRIFRPNSRQVRRIKLIENY